MFQNWISLISNFKFSLPNILFFIFLFLGLIIWKLYSDISKKQNQKNNLSNLFPNFSTDSFQNNNFPFPLESDKTQKTGAEIKAGMEIEDFLSKGQELQIRPEREIKTEREFKTEALIPKEKELQIKQIDNLFSRPIQISQTETLNELIQSENKDKPLPLKSPNSRINILKKVSMQATEQDFDGYIALEEIPPEQEGEEENHKKSLVFCPLLEVKGISIPRFKQISALKKSLEANEVLFLISPPSVGKSYLVSLLAREIKYSETRSIISFSFSQNTSSLAEAMKLILIEQLKLPAQSIENPIQAFLKIVSKEPFLILFNNVEFLSNNDLMLLYNCSLGKSKAILLSSSLSARSLFQNKNLVRRSIIELQEIENEIVQNFFLERIPQAFSANPLLINKLSRFIKGNPLVLILFCSFVEREFRNNHEIGLEEVFKHIDNMRVLGDKSTPINLCKVLHLIMGMLTNQEKDILLFCSYLPLNSFSASLIEYIFDLPSSQGIQFLDSLTHLGLMQNLASEAFQNPRFIVHSSIKDFIYKEYKLEATQINQLVSRIILYFIDLLEDKNKIQRENSTFIISGLLYALKMVSVNSSQHPQVSKFNNIFEKAIIYFNSLGLYEQIENNILPILIDNLSNSQFGNSRASWERLIGLSYLSVGKSKNSPLEKIEIIEKGIQNLNSALSLYASAVSAHNIRQLHDDLGNSYLALSELSDAEANLILAIDHFKKAIQVQAQAANTAEYVQAHINLGNAYLNLYKIKPSTLSLKSAIQILSKILNTFGSDLILETRSLIHQSLGNALRSLANHEESISNLQSAINNYKAALEGASQRAVIYNSLGCCHWKLAKYHSPLQNLELAVSSYKKSIEFISQNYSPFANEIFTIEYAVTQNNLGTSYKTLASLKNPENNLNLALKSFKAALSIADKNADHNLIKVINQHLFELNNLVDSIIRHKPEHRDNMYKFKQTMTLSLMKENPSI